MKKIIGILNAAVIVLSLVLSICAYFNVFSSGNGLQPGVTLVKAPEQTKAQRPSCFPDPEANYIPMPESENLAEGKPVTAGGEHTDVYVISNINDGKTDTYWESKGYPGEVTIDLGGTYSVKTVAVRLNPSAIWEARKQEIAVLGSTDGKTFTEIAAAAVLQFDPATGNRVRIDFDAVDISAVRVVFTMNSASRTGGAQAAEIEVYG